MMRFQPWCLKLLEIVCSQVLRGWLALEEMGDTDDNAVGDGQDRLLLAASPSDALVVGMQGGSRRTSEASSHLPHNGTQPDISFGSRSDSRRLPPLCRFPGHTPAHQARGLADGKPDISMPISATLLAAAIALRQGIV
jgi:hypothetical protein